MGHTPETRKRAYEKMRARRDKWIKENGPCKHCGSWDDIEVDHIDPELKENHAVWSWKEDRMMAELAKCQALCHKCHAKKTYEQNYSHLPKHGSAGYSRGCRCDECREAVRIEKQTWRLKNFGSTSSAKEIRKVLHSRLV